MRPPTQPRLTALTLRHQTPQLCPHPWTSCRCLGASAPMCSDRKAHSRSRWSSAFTPPSSDQALHEQNASPSAGQSQPIAQQMIIEILNEPLNHTSGSGGLRSTGRACYPAVRAGHPQPVHWSVRPHLSGCVSGLKTRPISPYTMRSGYSEMQRA